MFGKALGSDEQDARAESDRGELKLVATGQVGGGLGVIAVVRGQLHRIIWCGEGMQVYRDTLPLPPGRIVRLDTAGPCAVTSDGRFWCWAAHNKRWCCAGNVREDA